MRNWLLVAMTAVVMSVSCIVCAAPSGTLIAANANDAVTADPHVNIYNYSVLLQKGPYEGLILIDQAGTVHPRLATSWEISNDGLTYTFHLRSGVTFTDGTPFNAEAVKYNIERLLGLGLHGSTYLPRRIAATVVDNLTVALTLEKASAPFFAGLSTALMVSPTAARGNEKDGDWGKGWLDRNAVGTGPYLLESWEKDELYRLTYNPDYWQGWEGSHYERIIIRVIPEQATRVQLLQSGEIDAAFGVADNAFLKMLEGIPSLNVTIQPTGEVVYLRLKNRGILADPKVRQAMMYVFPYTSFWRDAMRGRGSVVHGFIAPAVFGSDETLPEGHQDLSLAKQLLAEAGYPNGFSMEVWIISSYLPLEKPMAELFKEAAAKIGVTVEIKDLASVATYLGSCGSADVKEGPDAFGWSQGPAINEPLTTVLGMWYTGNFPPGTNYTHSSNPTYDALYEKAAATADDAARYAIYQEMQRILLTDVPAVPVGSYDRYVCQKDTVGGLAINMAGHIIDWYAVGPQSP